MTVLFGAQNIAGSAYFEVAHCNFEAATQLGVLSYRFKPFERLFGQRFIASVSEKGVRGAVASSHSASKLIQSTQPHCVRVCHQKSVGSRNIHSVFDNGTGHHDVAVARNKCVHRFFEFSFRHLPVSHYYLYVRHDFLHFCGKLVDVFDAVVDDKRLPSPCLFTRYGIVQKRVAVLGDIGLHGKPVHGRRFQKTHIAYARHRHMQRARYGRCRQSKHVDFAP